MNVLVLLGALLTAASIVIVGVARLALPLEAATVGVAASDFEFTPATINITAGDTVEWTFTGNIHTVTSVSGSELDSGDRNPGDTYSHTFATAGEYRYYCLYHGDAGQFAGMVGTVNVTAGATNTPQASATASATRTRTATAEASGTVQPSATAQPTATPVAANPISAPAGPGTAPPAAPPATGGAQPAARLPASGSGDVADHRTAYLMLALVLATGGAASFAYAGIRRRR
jgi:plastocyanin